MNTQPMTPLQRTLTTLGQREPDRVPLFLNLSLQGARELEMSLPAFFSRPENIARAQLRMEARYHGDCLSAFHYGAVEFEAFGGETIFSEDGPPNSGEPIIKRPEDILSLESPVISECKALQRVLEATRLLYAARGGEVPIVGVAISPFSLPVMQMGFEAYLNLIYERPELLPRLMQVNQQFCIAWANAQLAAGATAIVYFDPVSSSTIVTPAQFRALGMPVACQTIAQIHGPVGIHFASGRCLPILADVIQTGAALVGVSTDEDLRELKQAAGGKLTLAGNLNGVEMVHWSSAQAEAQVKQAIARGAKGGGFILTDNHGEIPYQVPPDVISAISTAVHTWGKYPLDWTYENT